MENFPLVSIVTPAFNQAEYLSKTIDSVLAQDYPHIEYIVLDDGSSDNTLDILRQYDGRLRWEHHANMGQAQTLNKGWGISQGSIVGYISSDDLLHPNAVSEAVRILSENPQAVVSYPDFELIDKCGRSFRKVKTENFDVERLTEDLVCQPGPGAFFRKELLAEIGGWNANLRQVPDFEFWLRAAKKGPFIRIDRSLAYFRIHEESTSFRWVASERSNEIVDVMQAYWGDATSSRCSKSMSQAFMLAAKSHAQSGRFCEATKSSARAIALNWKIVFSVLSWRHIISGLMRRGYYKLFFKRESN